MIWPVVPVWVAQLPPTSGVDPTRLPVVEKSSLTRMVGKGGGGGEGEGEGGGGGAGGAGQVETEP